MTLYPLARLEGWVYDEPPMAGGRDAQEEGEHRLEIADYLDRVISQAGFASQAELAREIGVSPSQVSHWLSRNSSRGISAYNMLRVLTAAERRRQGVSTVDVENKVVGTLDEILERLDGIAGTVADVRRDQTRFRNGLATALDTAPVQDLPAVHQVLERLVEKLVPVPEPTARTRARPASARQSAARGKR